jgi:hypothetical protein
MPAPRMCKLGADQPNIHHRLFKLKVALEEKPFRLRSERLAFGLD